MKLADSVRTEALYRTIFALSASLVLACPSILAADDDSTSSGTTSSQGSANNAGSVSESNSSNGQATQNNAAGSAKSGSGSEVFPWNNSENSGSTNSGSTNSRSTNSGSTNSGSTNSGSTNSGSASSTPGSAGVPPASGSSGSGTNPGSAGFQPAPGANSGSTKIEHHNSSSTQHQNTAARPGTTHGATPAASSSPAKPMVLYGRIEQLAASAGASLPLKLTAMTPMRDTSLDKTPAKALSGNVTQSFPMDFRGTWSGELTVFSFNFDKTAWEFDRAETYKEYQILKPGTKGRTSVTFYQNQNKIQLEPSQVVFNGSLSDSSAMSQMKDSPLAGLFAGAASGMANMQVPMYALHLGDLSSGRGVTGNELNSQLMKNTLRQLAPGVVEQNVVTKDSDRNATTGKVKNGYSENVIRFTRQTANQLYVQAATVSYRNDGKFQTKIILYGTLDRSGAGGYSANPYNSNGNPFGASPFGAMPGGGAGNMGQSMEMIQKMMQQMNGAAGR